MHVLLKSVVLILFLFGGSTIVTSQNSGFLLGVGGEFTYNLNNYIKNPISGFNHNYQNIPSFGYGIRFGFLTKKKLGIHMGINYSVRGFKLVYDWTASSTLSDPQIPLEIILESKYLDIPIEFSYRLLSKEKLELRLMTGMVISTKLSEKEVTIMGDLNENETDYFHPGNANLLLNWRFGAVGDLNLGEKIGLSIYPYVMKGLTNMHESVILTPQWGVGGLVEIKIKI